MSVTPSGFLLNIWDAINQRDCILIEDSTSRVIAVECESPELAAELIRVAKDDTIWYNPIPAQLVQSENIVYLIW